MAMVQCPNGHLYDDRKHTHCPHCPVPGFWECHKGHLYDARKHTHCPYCPVPGLITGKAQTVLKILTVIGATIALLGGIALIGLRWGVVYLLIIVGPGVVLLPLSFPDFFKRIVVLVWGRRPSPNPEPSKTTREEPDDSGVRIDSKVEVMLSEPPVMRNVSRIIKRLPLGHMAVNVADQMRAHQRERQWARRAGRY